MKYTKKKFLIQKVRNGVAAVPVSDYWFRSLKQAFQRGLEKCEEAS